jgi:hypothetical protein
MREEEIVYQLVATAETMRAARARETSLKCIVIAVWGVVFG